MTADAASGGGRATITVERAQRIDRRVSYLSRWLYVWITLLVLAALTTVAFLILIAMALHRVDDNVTTASRAVGSVRGNTSVLPGQIATVNDHLADVDTSLRGVPADLRTVNSALDGVHTDLGTTHSRLADTGDVLAGTEHTLGSVDGTLGSVAGSLADTGGTLVGVRGNLSSVRDLAGDINHTLVAADRPPNTLDNLPVTAGAAGIYMRVAIVNDRLRPALADTGDILAELDSVNAHLRSTCRAAIPELLGAVPDVPDLTAPRPRYGAPSTVGTPC